MAKKKQRGLTAGELYLRRKGGMTLGERVPGSAPDSIPAEHLELFDRLLAERREKRIASLPVEPPQPPSRRELPSLAPLERDGASDEVETEEQRYERERERQTALRRARGVRPRDEWRDAVGQQARETRRRVVELYRLGLNLSAIARELKLSREWVSTIVREDEPTAEPWNDWRQSVRNEPLRSRCVEMRKSGASISAISREVGVVRARVRTVLREEGVE